jgi:hypothetical protein
MLTTTAAAKWLSKRLDRSVSRLSIQKYISRGDLPAINLRPGSKRPLWAINESDLEALALRSVDGALPIPTGGWHKKQNPSDPKANGLAAFAH